ncbi:MAG: FkbM family methyltransferase [Phycisphaeraceae bacterium]|nr:FkbM family methyltransferase [Phycisphaeraceae bacterium]
MHERSWKRAAESFESILEQRGRAGPAFFFVQIGANDGVRNDPLRYWILKYGWSGIFVEPLKPLFDRLRKNYASPTVSAGHLFFENSAIADENGSREIFKLADKHMRTEGQHGLASFYTDRALSTFASRDMLDSEIVNCMTLDSLFEKYNVSKIDLLQIDTEGYDFEIIKLIDFNRFCPRIIHFEHRHLSSREYKACLSLLRGWGYKVIEKQYDTAAVQPDNDAGTKQHRPREHTCA